MNRREAIVFVNERTGYVVLNGNNSRFSNVNKSNPVWWLNIPPEKFKRELHILLAKKNDRGLIWLKIEAHTFPDLENVFKMRRDKGVVDLEISSEGIRYLCDVKSGGTGYNFRRHIQEEWEA